MAGLVIARKVLIEAPAEVVWRTIAEPGHMGQWFADRVELVIGTGLMATWVRDQGAPVVVERSIRRPASHSARTIPAARSRRRATRCSSRPR